MIKNMNFLIILKLIFEVVAQLMDPLYQVHHSQIFLIDKQLTLVNGYNYGLWSKYNPLSLISQVGPVGLFDSNCFQLHNVVSLATQSLNLLYFDCLNYQSKIITKTILFIDNNNEEHEIKIEIDTFQYENIWYYFGINGIPKYNQLEIILLSPSKVFRHEILQISYPFYDIELQLTYGSSLIVQDSKIQSIQSGNKFSYFPGPIILKRITFENFSPDLDMVEQAKLILGRQANCQCIKNKNKNIADSELNKLNQGTYLSEYLNCDYFLLAGWIRIKDIINSDDEFLYQFLRLAFNFENSKFSNQNLHPFSFYYRISPQQNKIIVTTYSYTFPIVSLDFSDNPFLIVREFNIINDITVWHHFYVKLEQNKIDINIRFFQEYNVYEFKENFDVYQFKESQFKLCYGNCQQFETNYLNIQIKNLIFQNCNEDYTQQTCHISCQDCDGPTNKDCLSCSTESNRIYLNKQKACICPYNTVDDEICHSYQESGLIMIEDTRTTNLCSYGYFEYQFECFQCPSIVRENSITCLECLQNPKNWSQKPKCQTNIYINPNGNIMQTFLAQSFDNFIFDSQIVSLQDTNFNNLEILVSEFNLRNQQFKEFCTRKLAQCYTCELFGCSECYISIQGQKCQKCFSQFLLIDGLCKSEEFEIINTCVSPYYINSNKECKYCPIQYCKYCFEYQEIEQQLKCTLYKDFETFQQEDIININLGCALCEDQYIFDFNLGVCKYQKPQIQDCLRSYINLQGQEICTLSSLPDFNLALEIINCQKFIPNCIQCILNPDQKIQCIICKTGYSNQVQTGNCFENPINNAIIVMEGDFYSRDAQQWFIQSFMMEYLPNKYYYPPRSESKLNIYSMPTKCAQGYDLTIYQQCAKLCSLDCLQCIKSYEEFICQQCPNNYFNQQIRNQEQGQCIICPQLCEVCRNREEIQIYNIQPVFKLTENNKIYTKICLKQIKQSDVVIDPYHQIAKQCFNNDCWNHFLFDLTSTMLFETCENQVKTEDFIDFEDKINIDYCNQIGVDQITVDYTFHNELTEDICQTYCPIILQTNLKTKIFSLKRSHLKVTHQSPCIINIQNSTIIENFDKVEIFNIAFKNLQPFIFSNDKKLIDLKLFNFTIKDSSLKNLNIIQTDYFGDIFLKEVTLLNLNLENSSILNLQSFLFDGQIEIDTLLIQNSFIYNSELFILANQNFNVSIKQITIDSCLFINSTIFRLFSDLSTESKFIEFANIIITNSEFTNSQFIGCENNFNLNVIGFEFTKNFVSRSIIISFDYNLELYGLQIIKNIFIQSQFIATKNVLNKDQIICNVANYSALENQFDDANLFLIFSSLTINNIVFQMTDIKIEEVANAEQSNTQIQLFKIHGQSFYIKNAIIQNIKNCIAFYIIENQFLIIENVVLQSTQAQQKIPLSLKCIDDLNLKDSSFLYINGFQNLQLLNQYSSQSQIQIIVGKQFYNYSFGEIQLTNIIFEGNLLIQRENADLFSLLVIYSQNKLKILIDNINFRKNFLHQFIDNPLETSAGLIYIQSQLSFIEIKRLFCEFNMLTNSSNSFIFLNSYSIKISKFSIKNHNVLPQELLESVFQIQLNQDLNQEEINLFLQQSFKVLNKGGASQIIASEFSCTDCHFYNILAHQSAIFDIKTQKQGEIQLNGITAKFIESNLQQTSSSGCITIYSQNSNLNLKIQNAQFINILNRMSSTILSIQPSAQENKIIFNNIQIINCISLINQLFSVYFSTLNLQTNFFNIQNVSVTQTEEYLVQYFQKIGIVSQQEILSIIGENNSMIAINQGNIKIIQFFVQGVFFLPILKLNNLIKLTIKSCWLQQIQTFYPFSLISISQSENFQSIVYINELHIIKSSAFSMNSSQSYFSNQVDSSYLGCVQFNNFIKKNIQINLKDIAKNFIELASNSSALIEISINSIQNSLIVSNLNIKENNCTHCYNGIINLQILNFNKLKIQELYCGFNLINEYGCLQVMVNSQKYPTIQIKNSNFINNKGNIGAAIKAQNIFLKLDTCRIFGNQATLSGGGIHLIANKNLFLIRKSSILFNQAREGGGIYLDGNNELNNLNFVASYLFFNKAILYGNNLIETPNHLALSINGKEMKSQSFFVNSTQINLLKLKPYKTIEQGIKIITNILILPSNQQIISYSFYQPNSQRYIQYLSNFSLFFKNSQNEQLLNEIDSYCNVSQSLVQADELINDKFEQKAKILFDNQNNYFNLGTLSLTLNPYQQENYWIKLRCQTTDSQKNIDYFIKTKGFQCQLGGFYIDNGCQICQSNQGFYSVTYNTTKCSVFDKTKYQSVTSNKIELLKGYWRSNIFSDSVDYCFKNPKFCEGGWNVGDELCSIGHIGGLCEECDSQNIRGNGKFVKTQQELNCLSCYGDDDSILPFILTSIWALLSIILTLKSIKQSNQLFTSLKLNQKFFSIVFKLSQDHESIFLKMLLNYLWIYSIIFTFNISFSFSFIFVDQASNTSSFMANNLDCYLSEIEQVHLIYSRIITMLLLMILQLLLILTLSYIHFRFTRQGVKQKYQFDTISSTLIYLYVSNFGGLIKMFCSVISKREISNLNLIQGDVSLEYWSQNHFQWTVAFIIPGLVIFCILIPFSLLAIMYKLKDQFNSIRNRRHISYLFNEYNSENYFWELIKLVKKTIIILIITYFETNILLKASLLGLCLLFYQLLAVKQKPYIIQNLNSLDLQTGQICSISIFIAAAKYVCEQQNNQTLSILLQIVIIILCFLLCYPFIRGILIIYYKKYNIFLLSSIMILFEKINKDSIIASKFKSILKRLKTKEKKLKNNLVRLRDSLKSQQKIKKKMIQNLKTTIDTELNTNLKLESIIFLIKPNI